PTVFHPSARNRAIRSALLSCCCCSSVSFVPPHSGDCDPLTLALAPALGFLPRQPLSLVSSSGWTGLKLQNEATRRRFRVRNALRARWSAVTDVMRVWMAVILV